MTKIKNKMWIGQTVLIVLLTPLILPVLLLFAVALFLLYCLLYGVAWFVWIPKGRDVFIVTSDSPIWREYMERELVAKLANRSMILNWSHRAKWSRFYIPGLAMRLWGGSREFNPMVLVFKRFRRVKIFRYWDAFIRYKHGDRSKVESLTKDIFEAVSGK